MGCECELPSMLTS